MKAIADLPIRKKIAGIILVTTFLALGIGFTLVIWTSVRSFESELVKTTSVVAHVVGGYSAISLYFDDRPEAAVALRQLADLPEVLDAYLFDNSGQLFSAWHRADDVVLPEVIHESHWEFREGQLHYFAPVTFENRKYGTIFVRMSTEALDREIREYLFYMSALMLALVVAAIFFAYFLQGFISKPILDLAGAAQRISAEADYSIRMTKPGNDEIGILYDTFNAMLAQIERRQEELERSNRDLDQFAYVASHDLKAPLRAIATLSGWIEEDLSERLSEEGQEQMRLLRSRVKRMDALIEGILEYSRVRRSEHRGEPVDVGALLRDLVELISPPPGFTVHVAADMPTMVTPRLRLEQVFSNLITNAIKYHHRRDGRVEISVRRLDGLYEFAVADDGPGIAPEHHEKVFWMFQTLQPRDKVESTGLGLALVKKLVEEEGGRVSLESDVGRGAIFRFTWPVAVPAADDSRTTPAKVGGASGVRGREQP